MTLLYVGLDLGQRSDYTALSIIRASELEVEVPESAQTLAAGYGLPSLSMLPGFYTSQCAEAAARRQFDYDHAKWVAQGRIEQGTPQLVRVRVPRYEGVHLHRFPLGTSYPAMVRYVCDLLRTPQMRGQTAALALDATGVGVPVLDLFREAPDLGTPVIAISITAGNEPHIDATGLNYWVPKRDLVGVLTVLMPEPRDEQDPHSVPPDAARLLMSAALPLTTLFLAEAYNFKAKINARGHDAYEAGGVGQAGEWREGEHDDVVLSVALACWYAHRGVQLTNAARGHVAAGPPTVLGAGGRRRSGPRQR
ncbi:MAG TPA: hypothetical protein VE338_12515 [Ktedonobacterales bacterium]|jgi:hypothetical protein|nr:hypothetical protein [Ktedonobacterales bacterium]